MLPLLIGPSVLVLSLHLKRPNAAVTMPIIVLVLAVIVLLLALTQRPALRKLQQRLDQLAVITEKT